MAAALLTVVSQADARTRRRMHADAAWTVTIETSGGFTGRGRGSVAISGAGNVAAQPPAVPGASQGRCTARLTAAELATLRTAIDSTDAESWDGKRFGAAAADAMTYTLTLRRGGRTWTATWFDSSRQEIPERLSALADAVETGWTKATDECRRGR
jgi:hypothetical protein